MKLIYNNKDFKIIGELNTKLSNSEVTFNIVRIDFSKCTFADIPLKYQKVEIKNENNIVFCGYVDKIKLSTMKNKNENRELQLTLLSPLKMATIRTSSVIGTYTVKRAIQMALQPLIDDGFKIAEQNFNNGQITLNYVLETVENIMNKICNKRNLLWYIDEKKNIYINSVDYLFGLASKMIICDEDDKHEIGLLNIDPTIENINYANIINFKNVRLIYSSDSYNNKYPILTSGKVVKKGDIVKFDIPVIVDEKILRQRIEEEGAENRLYYAIMIEGEYIGIELEDSSNSYYNKWRKTSNIGFSNDSGAEKRIVLQRDNFFQNLITGFKWNGDTVTLNTIQSDTALRYTVMKFNYSKEIEKLKGKINDSGQIERTVDFNQQWTTLKQLIEYARSLIVQNKNEINEVTLKFDKNPNLKIGNIVELNLPSYFSVGVFAIKEIDYYYYNELHQIWTIKLKKSDFLYTYIDLFRPAEKENSITSIDNIVFSEFIEETIQEKFNIEIGEG